MDNANINDTHDIREVRWRSLWVVQLEPLDQNQVKPSTELSRNNLNISLSISFQTVFN